MGKYRTHEKKIAHFLQFLIPEIPTGGPLGPLGGPKARYPSVLLLVHLTGGPKMRFSTTEWKKKDFNSVFP